MKHIPMFFYLKSRRITDYFLYLQIKNVLFCVFFRLHWSFCKYFLLTFFFSVIATSKVFATSIMINEDKLILGKSFFEKPWVSFPASTTARDGLGPIFNQNACVNCHPKGGRSDKFVVKLNNPDTIYGVQINTQSNANVPVEAEVEIDYKTQIMVYANGDKTSIKNPIIRLQKLGYGKVGSLLSMRISPSLHGLSLLESIVNKPINRFNLSADKPSILAQVADAAHNDMGLTSLFYPQENCSHQQIKCKNAPKSNTLDLPQHRLEAITYFVKSLNKVSAVKPISLFVKIGCSICHTPSYMLKNQAIYPYTDLLTHDLGEGKFRTAPLWNSNKAPNFWHDGRANTIEEAILWHNGEASKARLLFMNLSKINRSIILKFIERM